MDDSLRAQNDHLRAWEEYVADKRIHGTTKKQVGQVFQEIERPALKALPNERFACFEEGARSVYRDGHVEVARAYYSTPPEYVSHDDAWPPAIAVATSDTLDLGNTAGWV